MSRRVDERDQVRALTRAFFSRFFESEITTGADDMKGTFFWLLAALAIPGIFIPWARTFDWQGIIFRHGAEALREASQADKVFYLGFTMIASGLLTAIAWSSLLPDRRDTLILGALPVGPRTIVRAKLAALAGYVLLVAVAMHAIGAVFFGAILSFRSPFRFLVSGIVAHFVATCAASVAVAISVAAAQGLTLAITGPRLFRRLAIVLQVVLVGLIALALASLPVMTSSTVDTLRGWGRGVQPWILSTPPLWFLGLYEVMLGTTHPVLVGLAIKAVMLLGIAIAVALISYPLAYRRLLVSVVETGDASSKGLVGRTVRGALVGTAGRNPRSRAAADFYTATIARVERHRFVLAIAVGIALAWGLPSWRQFDPASPPRAALLSLPLTTMMLLIAGLRIAASLPGDVRAGWLFDVRSPTRAEARRALERVMFILGVVPPVALSAPAYWWLWGTNVALVHAVVSLALGLVLVELLIWNCEGMPCGQRWNPVRLDLGRRWPLVLAVFLIVTAGVPRLELLLFRSAYLTGAMVVFLIVLAGLARYASARHQIVPTYEELDPVAGVLRLN
jgi:hypothetical protein